MQKNVDLEKTNKLQSYSVAFSQVADSYLFSHITSQSTDEMERGYDPIKLEGSLIIMMNGGTPFNIEVDGETINMRPGTILTTRPGNIIKNIDDKPEDLDAYLLYFNLSFLQNVNINLSAISIPPLIERPKKYLRFESHEADVIRKYFELIYHSSLEQRDQQISKCIASSLIAAMFYQMVQFYQNRTTDVVDKKHTDEVKQLSRRHDYVREFIHLVQIHFIKERSVAFYAERLFISPKYLSLLVKEATGRSAAKWIDEFVLMEAKNMLRYSGRNIQQVAYALNFPTQSSFGKYFKHLTGMSPTDYQRS